MKSYLYVQNTMSTYELVFAKYSKYRIKKLEIVTITISIDVRINEFFLIIYIFITKV